MKNKILLLLIVFAVTLMCSGCKKKNTSSSGSGSSTQGANEVWIQNMAFGPATLTVAVNTTVKWTNKDGVAHTVTSNNALFDSGNINSGATFSHQFITAGTYSYHCAIHPSMTGTILVQ